MAKYRKKPVIVDAVQWHPGVEYEAVKGTTRRILCGCGLEGGEVILGPHIHTLEGSMRVSDGDWIIQGVQGEYYPCKPDIFEKTYELVKEYEEVLC